MYLFFDTETTGLPSNWQAPVSDIDNWPRLVQLSWAWYDNNGNQWDFYDFIIRPNGFIIPEESSKIHRISHKLAEEKGKDLEEIISLFSTQVKQAEYIVAHNISFDEKIVGAELFRLNKEDIFSTAKKICTMKTTASVCCLPSGRGGYKWPNLNELHSHLFQEEFSDAHNALVDVFACAKCFFALKKRDFNF
jgi:DNA polymerase III subunit epsilon